MRAPAADDACSNLDPDQWRYRNSPQHDLVASSQAAVLHGVRHELRGREPGIGGRSLIQHLLQPTIEAASGKDARRCRDGKLKLHPRNASVLCVD
jgi:hypothetical protein